MFSYPIIALLLTLQLAETNSGNIYPLYVPDIKDVSAERDLNAQHEVGTSVTMSVVEMQDFIRSEIEKYDLLKIKSPTGRFFSKATKSYEKCENFCPNGTDITLCGEECEAYYLNKTMVEAKQQFEKSLNEFSDFKQEIQKQFAISKEENEQRMVNLQDEVANQNSDIQDLQSKYKIVKEEAESSDPSAVAAVITALLVLVIEGLLICWVYKEMIDKNKKMDQMQKEIKELEQLIENKIYDKCSDDVQGQAQNNEQRLQNPVDEPQNEEVIINIEEN